MHFLKPKSTNVWKRKEGAAISVRQVAFFPSCVSRRFWIGLAKIMSALLPRSSRLSVVLEKSSSVPSLKKSTMNIIFLALRLIKLIGINNNGVLVLHSFHYIRFSSNCLWERSLWWSRTNNLTIYVSVSCPILYKLCSFSQELPANKCPSTANSAFHGLLSGCLSSLYLITFY